MGAFWFFCIYFFSALSFSQIDPQQVNHPDRIRRSTILRPEQIAAEFHHIIIDARNSRGGNGDIGGAYLTAIDFINRLHYQGQITLVGGDEAVSILTKLTGIPIQDGTKLQEGRLTFFVAENLHQKIPPADLYISVANPSGAFKSSSKTGGFRPEDDRQWISIIPLEKNAVLVAQTVLGNTENRESVNPTAVARVNGLDFDLEAAGIAGYESGIYYDDVALKLRGKGFGEVRDFLLNAIEKVPDEKIKQIVHDVVSGQSLGGAKVGMAYGLSKVGIQFHSYLSGLVDEAKKNNESFVFVTPSSFKVSHPERQESWASDVIVLEPGENPPSHAESGKVYVVRTGTLPHDVFVGLMAFAQMPLVVAGDGAMSAAINLGKPFWMTKIDWNYRNIQKLKDRIERAPLSQESRDLLNKILNDKRPNLVSVETHIDASEALKMLEPQIAQAYWDLQNETPSLTDTLLEAAGILKQYYRGLSGFVDLASTAHDPLLRRSLLLNFAEKGDSQALRILIKLLRKSPQAWAFALLRDRFPTTLLKNETIRTVIEKEWVGGTDSLLVRGGVKAMEFIGDERAKRVLLAQGVRYTETTRDYRQLFEETAGVEAFESLLAMEPNLFLQPTYYKPLLENSSPQVLRYILSGIGLNDKWVKNTPKDSDFYLQLGKLLFHPDQEVRSGAAFAIWHRSPHPGPELVGDLKRAIYTHGSEHYFVEALASTRTKDVEASLLILDLMVKRPTDSMALGDSAEALIKMGSSEKKVLDRLEALLSDPNSSIALNVASVLAEDALRSDDPDPALNRVAKVLRSHEFSAEVKKRVLKTLARVLPRVGSFSGLMELIRSLRPHADSEALGLLEKMENNVSEAATKFGDGCRFNMQIMTAGAGGAP